MWRGGERSYDVRSKSSVGSLRRFWAVVLGLAAIYVNLLASAAAAPIILDAAQPSQFGGTEADGRSAVSLLRVVICSPNGTAIVDGIPYEADHDASCAFCTPLMSGSIAAPGSFVFLEITFSIALAPPIPRRDGSCSKFLVQIAQPRAPPAV
jgi:hypothetical protein